MRYLPHTPEQIEQMLKVIGVKSVDDLFEPIPPQSRLSRPLAMEPALDEVSLMRHIQELADLNQGARMLSFQGAGAYDHHIPPAVDQLLLRSEFTTSYTPYQAEVSQGTLQSVWEFQTIVSEILGHPVANASMYDGASAAAEAALMARRITKRNKVIVCEGVHPEYVETIETYMSGLSQGASTTGEKGQSGIITRLPIASDGTTDMEKLAVLLDQSDEAHKVAAVVVGYPNFYGCVMDLQKLADVVHEAGALLVTATAEPYALALVAAPGQCGADISVAEGQPIATSVSYGGPGVGLFATRNERKYLQEIPGRLVGETVDNRGQRGYVLTLATREQHIRRERATSNICTNQGLIALSLAIRMCLLGKCGFEQVAKDCLAKMAYLRDKIVSIPGYELVYPKALNFNEFAVKVPLASAELLVERVAREGILAGVPLGRYFEGRDNQLLIAVTEKHTKEDLDKFVKALPTS